MEIVSTNLDFFFFFLESLELSFKKSTNTSLAVLNTARILLSHSFCGTGNEDLFGWFWISRAFCSWMMAGAGWAESSWWLAGNLPLLTVMQCLHVGEFGLLQSFEASEPSECLQGGSRLRGECSAHKAELNCFLWPHPEVRQHHFRPFCWLQVSQKLT